MKTKPNECESKIEQKHFVCRPMAQPQWEHSYTRTHTKGFWKSNGEWGEKCVESENPGENHDEDTLMMPHVLVFYCVFYMWIILCTHTLLHSKLA